MVNALGKKKIGLTRNEISEVTKLSNSGFLTKILDELISCGFIRKYTMFGKKTKDAIYQLTDQYSLFYFQSGIIRAKAQIGICRDKLYCSFIDYGGITMEMDKDFRGNAYIVKKEVLLNYSGGFADLANEIPNTIETRFASASMSKTFVAVGILQLIEAEKLEFEDTIGAILDFDLKHIDPYVTVRQLLNHTSGVPDYFDESVMDDYEALWTDYPNYRIRHNRDMLPLFIDKPMMYNRGERFQYNNSGYVLLAMIIEAITGMDFDVYLKQNVFDRCDMFSTGYFSFDKLPAKCANSYIYCPETEDYRTNIYSVGAKGTGDGGAFVTVGDIVKLWNGLIGYKLLSKDMVMQMFSKQSGDGKDPEEGYYGFGLWIIDNPKGQDYVYMQGCDEGVSAISEYNPNNGMITVILSNYGDNVWARMRKIREEMY